MEGLSAKQLGVIRSFSRTFQAKLCKFATGAKPAHIKLLCHSRSAHLRFSSGCPRLSSGCSRSHSRPIRRLCNFTGFAENVPAYPPPAKNAAACFLKRRPPVLLCLFYRASLFRLFEGFIPFTRPFPTIPFPTIPAPTIPFLTMLCLSLPAFFRLCLSLPAFNCLSLSLMTIAG